MRISIIIPCFNAIETIERAVSGIMAQRVFAGRTHPHDIEVILAVDDDNDYAAVRRICPDVVILPPVKGRIGTGPGATRNRGILAASGDMLGFLDADDEWSHDYLAELLPLARHHGAAFAPTSIITHRGEPLLTLAEGQRILTPADFGYWPGSFHPLVHRSLSHGFSDGVGQDVFHALSVLGRVGGQAPLARSARYKLHLKKSSVTADPGFGRKIDKRYRTYINAYQKGETSLYGMARHQAIQALYRRMWWNASWLNSGGDGHGFYGFVAKQKNI